MSRVERRPIAMTEDENGGYTVLCDDGTVWISQYDLIWEDAATLRQENYRWQLIPYGPIPGTPAALSQDQPDD